MDYNIDCILAVSNDKFWKDVDGIIEFIRKNYTVIDIEDVDDNTLNLVMPTTKLKKLYNINLISNGENIQLILYNNSIHISGLLIELCILTLNLRKVIPIEFDLLLFDVNYEYSIKVTQTTQITDIIEIFPDY